MVQFATCAISDVWMLEIWTNKVESGSEKSPRKRLRSSTGLGCGYSRCNAGKKARLFICTSRINYTKRKRFSGKHYSSDPCEIMCRTKNQELQRGVHAYCRKDYLKNRRSSWPRSPRAYSGGIHRFDPTLRMANCLDDMTVFAGHVEDAENKSKLYPSSEI